MIYRARTENNEMFIAMYETEKPQIFGHYRPGSVLYDIDIKKWLSSKREYEVGRSDEWEIYKLLFNPLAAHSFEQLSFSQREALEKGIDCTFLKDRLKLERYPELVDDWGNVPCEWTLLPLEDKKENEAEIHEEYINYFLNLDAYFNRETVLEQLKGLFTITRKPNIQEPE